MCPSTRLLFGKCMIMTGREFCSPSSSDFSRTMMAWPVFLEMSLMLMLVSSPPVDLFEPIAIC